MKCYFHNNHDAIAFCSQCNKSLCNVCYDEGTNGLCHDCAISNKKYYKKQKFSSHLNYLIFATVCFLAGGVIPYLMGLTKDYSFIIVYGCLAMALHSGFDIAIGTMKEFSTIIIVFSVVFFYIVLVIILFVGFITFFPRFIYHLFMAITSKTKELLT